jgi:hypothetical protein
LKLANTRKKVPSAHIKYLVAKSDFLTELWFAHAEI